MVSALLAVAVRRVMGASSGNLGLRLGFTRGFLGAFFAGSSEGDGLSGGGASVLRAASSSGVLLNRRGSMVNDGQQCRGGNLKRHSEIFEKEEELP